MTNKKRHLNSKNKMTIAKIRIIPKKVMKELRKNKCFKSTQNKLKKKYLISILKKTRTKLNNNINYKGIKRK